MGLTSFKGSYTTTQDISIAKNYLSESELKQLNLIVSLYLDFAELQATNQRAMNMTDWVGKLDDFLKLSEKGILNDAGTVSSKRTHYKAEKEYKEYRKEQEKNHISDFDKTVKNYIKERHKKLDKEVWEDEI